jgi:DedD protein
MGLFSRKESATGADQQRSRARSSMSSEAQADEMRSRARRRLIGALALVIAAVIVVPMLINTSPPEEQPTPLVVPAIPPLPAPGVAAVAPEGAATGPVTEDTLPVPDSEPAQSAPEPQVAEPVKLTPEAESKAAAEAKAAAETRAAHDAAKAKAAEKPAHKEPPKTTERTDDGSVAIALLEGRKPAKKAEPAATAKGNFVLQIAAYTVEKDAQARREKLAAAGVSNAYVETSTTGGKSTYRLRVGPFPTRDAAQAAQTRLRALGYENGFISSK